MAFKSSSSLPSLLFLSTLFLASDLSFADHELDRCIQQCPAQDLRCLMGCLQQKYQGVLGGMQPLIPREAYQKYCQKGCEMKERDPKMQQECQRNCMEDFEQQQKQEGGRESKGLQGGGDINDHEGEMWETMREDLCEKICKGADDQQQQELCERSCHKKLTLQYKQCRQSCQKEPNGKSKLKVKQCQTQCREKIEKEQQEQLEQQEQEQQAQAQAQEQQQAQQEQDQQGQRAQPLGSIMDPAAF